MYVALLPDDTSGTLLINLCDQVFVMAAESMPFFSRNRKRSPRYVDVDSLFLCQFLLTGDSVGHYYRSILQRRHHNHQALDSAAVSPAFSTSSTQTHHLDCRRLRYKLLVDHYFTHHLSMPTDSCGLGSFSEGRLPQVKRGLHRSGHMQYYYRHDSSLPTHATNLAITNG